MFRLTACTALILGLAACTGATGLSDPSLRDQVLAMKSDDPAACWTEVTPAGKGRPGWYRSLCPAAMTPYFRAQLQGALALRHYYSGPPDGQETQDLPLAIERYQSDRGLPSTILSYRAAQQLGLVPWIGAD